MATGTAGHLALYRKYRSATFAEVIGQDHVTEPLRAALAAGRINHAYLFSGPRGCGKTSSARILARSLNCAQGPTPDPCGVCDSCVELAPNGPGSIDVIEIDAASHGGVDDARDLRERAFFAPVRDRFKVYIIDEAHMVTAQGFNALLTLVEEPPEFLVFVFATTEPDKVLTTIRSRTHHYPFRLIPPGVLRAHLEAICTSEQITVEPAVLPLVVRAGGGSARDALSILDQLLAGAGPDGVTYARAVALLGVTDVTLLDDMVDALAAADAAAVYGTVKRTVEAGHDPRRFAADLLERLRDLLLLDAVPDAASRGLIDVPEAQLGHMSDQAARLGGATLARYAEIVHNALLEMRGTTSPRLVLELLCARMQLPDAAADSAAILQRLERLERRATVAAGTMRNDEPRPAVEAEPAAQAPAHPNVQATAGTGLDGAALRRLWPDVLDVVKASSRRTRALLDNAQITGVTGEVISLSAPPALARMISEESNTELLRAALTKVVGGSWQVDVAAADAAGEGGTRAAVGASNGPTSRTPAAGADPRDDTEPDAPGEPPPAGNPEEAALRLLHSELGARPVDEG